MVKLLIIADDFTGALDTSIQFAKRGALTVVRTKRNVDYGALEPDISVVVVDSETRHVTAEEAYKVVSEIVDSAVKAKVPYIYKKTDSVLRGNVGAELAALCDRGLGMVHFAPAFPDMGRTTSNGIQYVDGLPIAKSVFGNDPFEPVMTSSIPELIKAETDTPVHLISKGEEVNISGKGIYLYDAENASDLWSIATNLKKNNQLMTLAGCAGFADSLASVMFISDRPEKTLNIPKGLCIVCGSVNPVTVRQMDIAEKIGIPRVHIDRNMCLNDSWINSGEAVNLVRTWISTVDKEGAVLLDVNFGSDVPFSDMRINPDDRGKVSENLGKIVKCMIDGGLNATLFLTGGDTLLGAMNALNVYALTPITEVMPGVVVSSFSYGEKDIYCISKSGGFGGENLIPELCEILGSDVEINKGIPV